MLYKIKLIFVLLCVIQVQCAENTKFSCDGRPQGYYADVNSGCQIYHMCDGIGRQFSYSCPNATLFQQRMLICDHWYMVNCSKSEPDFAANLLIGQRNKPFVEDSEKHPYHRTPRPDLSIDSNTTEFNIIYRSMRSRSLSDLNLVGVESDEENNASSSKPHQPLYSPPTHWFTEYSNDSTTPNALEKELSLNKLKKYEKPSEVVSKTLSKSNKSKTKLNQSSQSKYSNYEKITVNKNEAVTQSGNNHPVHRKFGSMKKLYNIRFNHEKPNSNNYKIKYQPTTTATNFRNEEILHDTQLEEIRKLFLIPDYDFPLESDYRPGYDNGPSSFQVK